MGSGDNRGIGIGFEMVRTSFVPVLRGSQMEDQRLAVHRTIVVVDIEGFGDHRRTNPDQVAVRAVLYRAMREAFGRAGISWEGCRHEDRGDGLFVLVPAEVPKGLLVEELPLALVTDLRAHNERRPGSQRIRLRMALHAGEVRYDGYGVTGASVNLAFRLLDASPLKAAQIPPGLEARSALWRNHLAGKKMLLVLDDAAGSEQVRPLLPGTVGCVVLVTSRRRLTALEGTTPISLDTLPPGQAADLFVRLAARPGLQRENSAVVEVVRLCGHLPLAIRLVAAGIRHHPARTVTDLADELAGTRSRLVAMQAENVSVTAAFDLSYQDLTIPQQRLFRRLGLHPGADIDAYAAAALDDIDPAAARHGLADLYEHNLLFEPTSGRYRFHDLLLEHARALAAGDETADQQAAVGRILDYYLHAAVAASRHTARRTFIAGPLSSGQPSARLPKLDAQEEAVGWLSAERLNLHSCVEYAVGHAQHSHATWGVIHCT
jgi:NB-ARC domain